MMILIISGWIISCTVFMFGYCIGHFIGYNQRIEEEQEMFQELNQQRQ